MLFELALAGIGGNTVHQVKSNLTMLEVRQWAEYRYRRGSLNIGRRLEQAAAHVMSFSYNTKAKAEERIDPLELMPHEDDIIESFEAQIDD
ncbi:MULTISPECIES: hypothetical protein [Psychrobacter]|uniref:Uncharacterized protein n=1 Tax=Psychrobacter faecalis TaxID=180588 RepID=A0ABT9HEC0_9GAMM|nr:MULTISPECIES: hypothetical protein [Psychrobacter]MDP4544114.1 hypothetical protein [Psychrobacter faecalis]